MACWTIARGRVEVGDVGAVRDSLAAERLDYVDDLLGRAESTHPRPHRRAEVVDDDLGALAGELERVLAAEAAAGSGDDGDASFTDESRALT